jgi:proprotein convertase subtilisin/kexin type 5
LASNGVKCQTCINGYFADPVSFLCVNCPETCITCTNLTLCTVCIDTYDIINGTCACDIGFGMYPTGQVCAPCSSLFNYCVDCQYLGGITTCLDCVSGTYLAADNFSCILCSPNCASCNIVGCIDCQPGFYKNGTGFCICSTSCSTIVNTDPACIECWETTNSSTNVTTSYCFACSPSYFNLAN